MQGSNTDKLTANVSFPLKELNLHQFASPETPCSPSECTYDLFGVSPPRPAVLLLSFHTPFLSRGCLVQ